MALHSASAISPNVSHSMLPDRRWRFASPCSTCPALPCPASPSPFLQQPSVPHRPVPPLPIVPPCHQLSLSPPPPPPSPPPPLRHRRPQLPRCLWLSPKPTTTRTCTLHPSCPHPRPSLRGHAMPCFADPSPAPAPAPALLSFEKSCTCSLHFHSCPTRGRLSPWPWIQSSNHPDMHCSPLHCSPCFEAHDATALAIPGRFHATWTLHLRLVDQHRNMHSWPYHNGPPHTESLDPPLPPPT
jgi:hypothetical protein